MEYCPKCKKTLATSDAAKKISNKAVCPRCGAVIKKRDPQKVKK